MLFMLISISVTVIAAIMVVFVIVLIPVLLQFRRTAKEGERLLEAARQQLVPLSYDLVRVIDDVQDIVKKGSRQMDKVEDSVSAVHDAALKLRDVETLFKDKVEKPLLNLITLLSALVKGTRAFMEYVKKE
jgi:hypothetical protein